MSVNDTIGDADTFPLSGDPTGGMNSIHDRPIGNNTVDAIFGIYTTYQEYEMKRRTPNVSAESAESLRQKVVNDYKTMGKNSDKPTIKKYTETFRNINRNISNTECKMTIYHTNLAGTTAAKMKYTKVTVDPTSYRYL